MEIRSQTLPNISLTSFKHLPPKDDENDDGFNVQDQIYRSQIIENIKKYEQDHHRSMVPKLPPRRIPPRFSQSYLKMRSESRDRSLQEIGDLNTSILSGKHRSSSVPSLGNSKGLEEWKELV